MADRQIRQQLPPANNGLSRPPARAATFSASSSSSVRRNLFQSQLTRRPTPSSSSTSAETLRLDTGPGGAGGAGGAAAAAGSLGDTHSESSDIVIRDKNGEVELGDPPTPPVDDADEGVVDTRQENEKERQQLAEAVKQHRIDQNSVPARPEELLEAVRASLRAKVAGLAEDNWMYEPEDMPRLHR